MLLSKIERDSREVELLLDAGKPLTTREIVARAGKDCPEPIAVLLDELTAEGALAKFRVGFNDYYAFPKEALTGMEPTLRTVMADSIKGLFLGYRYKASLNPKQQLRRFVSGNNRSHAMQLRRRW